jgi:hypothetical protein
MNWDQEIEVEGKKGDKVTLTIGEVHSVLLADLQMDDLEEFTGELLAWLHHREVLEEPWG